ncbi:MAG TPA: C4-dicarboxylate TRAP transporter substrate-binding protein [Ottowia sp.]|uniref:C4-dicarboxylate TRAP transporter substrate-binding protein n=1 Tax=Ottowia sp. TaxID=1898956 RepID=UPI002C63E8D1|nr:C4-dicarboxylate TRAP transporter substrate-binding protein [Ottowia sp.]HMN20869.1 C4-dicarboxylate TRAP transporter substrate-binding protein [Ottowia sp.]
MMTRRLIATAALLAAASLTVPAQAQQTIRLTAAAGHPPVFLWVKLVDEFFIPEVDKRLADAGSKVRIEWTRAWGGTLIKLGAESKGIADGVADLGFVGTIFEAAKFPMQNVSYYAPFGTDDIGIVTRVVNDMQNSIPAMGQAWTSNNLVYLGGAALDAYHIWTNFPLKSIDDLKGKKITAPGPAANWIKGTGAVAVAGNLNTYYEDIKSGVSNGVVTFATGAWGAKVHEVAPYITKVNFGAQYAGGLAINKKRFDKLPAEVQKVMREVGAEYSERFAATQTQTAAALLKKAEEAGARISELTPAERTRWADTLPPIAKTFAADLQARNLPGDQVLHGFMNGLKKAGAHPARDWAN